MGLLALRAMALVATVRTEGLRDARNAR